LKKRSRFLLRRGSPKSGQAKPFKIGGERTQGRKESDSCRRCINKAGRKVGGRERGPSFR